MLIFKSNFPEIEFRFPLFVNAFIEWWMQKMQIWSCSHNARGMTDRIAMMQQSIDREPNTFDLKIDRLNSLRPPSNDQNKYLNKTNVIQYRSKLDALLSR